VAEQQEQMMPSQGLVLDANILIRAVYGRRVRSLLEAYEERAAFYTSDVCFDEARRYIPELSKRRGLDHSASLEVLAGVGRIVQSVDAVLYADYRETANKRVLTRDPDDWPVVAVALLLDLPVWTEDQDLFGSGVATWTTDRVELYLRD
jgi:predicted nucleic acid-binding protein